MKHAATKEATDINLYLSCSVCLRVKFIDLLLKVPFCFRILLMASQSSSATKEMLKRTSIPHFRCLAHTQKCLCVAQVTEYLRPVRLFEIFRVPQIALLSPLGINMFTGAEINALFHPYQVFQEELGVVKSYNLKPGGDKIPVNNQNRKGE